MSRLRRSILTSRAPWIPPVRLAMAEAAAFGLLVMVVAFSAVVTKELTTSEPAPTLAVLDSATAVPQPVGPAVVTRLLTPTDPLIPAPGAVEPVEPDESEVVAEGFETDISIRYFNGRPVRPVRTIMMTVTAYSPDARSCGDSDDGITASLHDVYTNGFQLVAADTRLLPLGSMLTVPGYAGDKIVPVLDRGGKIKGSRLDVLYPTHETALRWGVKRLAVTIWQYADGKPADDWRRLRDSR